MRGNHIIWGRVQESTPDATTETERNRIATVKLRAMRGRSYHCKEVWLNGQRLGFVRIRVGGQYYKVKRNNEWLLTGHEWSESDPPWGLAILALLEAVENESLRSI
ncbi:MAG: hypothetical protein U0930_05100 [Pirellulales bacterium]